MANTSVHNTALEKIRNFPLFIRSLQSYDGSAAWVKAAMDEIPIW